MYISNEFVMETVHIQNIVYIYVCKFNLSLFVLQLFLTFYILYVAYCHIFDKKNI